MIRASTLWIILLCLSAPLSLGCRGSAAPLGQSASVWGQPAAGQTPNPYVAQMQDLNQRATQLDANNSDLHTQLAQVRQQMQLQQDQVALLQKRLVETTKQLEDERLQKTEVEKQAAGLLASARRGGGAIITPNNSLIEPLKAINIPGVEARQDQDVVRIELPADRLFRAGSDQMLPGAGLMLDQVADLLSRSYPRQRIVVEGHTDSQSQGAPGVSNHRISAAQAQAVMDYFATRTRLQEGQLAVMSHGGNAPLASNATPAGRAKNRRIEVVIYPETVTGG